MATRATVREWHDDEGWGVVDSPATPGGCWVHFSDVAVAGYRHLTAGQPVDLEWESPGQDGYAYRAVRVWPAGEPPDTGGGVTGPTTAYRSTLTLDDSDASTGRTPPAG